MKPIRSDGSTRCALVLFCRRPAPGVGKQRLSAKLGAATTAEVAAKLLDTALEDAADWPGPVIIAPANEADSAWASRLLTRDAAIIPQRGANLGERINAVDAQARTGDHRQLIFIGSDSPALTQDDYASARAALRDHDVVLIPAADGGVTLMGARAPWPPLANLRWSSENLATDLERCCTEAGLTLYTLPPGYDVDLTSDLSQLVCDLATDTRPARMKLYGWLKEFYG